MLDRFIVYALSDPRTNFIRYIGKSSVGLARPRSHFEPKRIAAERNLHKARWLLQLSASSLKPSIVVLERCESDAELLAAEVRWIAHGRASGWPLVNLTDGGDGAAGLVASAETREKLSATRRGVKRPASVGMKLSAAKTGKPNLAYRLWWESLSDEQRQAWGARSGDRTVGKKRPDLAARNASPEMRAVVRRPRSEETKKKMSEAALRRHARERDQAQPSSLQSAPLAE